MITKEDIFKFELAGLIECKSEKDLEVFVDYIHTSNLKKRKLGTDTYFIIYKKRKYSIFGIETCDEPGKEFKRVYLYNADYNHTPNIVLLETIDGLLFIKTV